MPGFNTVAEFRLMFFNDFGPKEAFPLGEIIEIEGNRINSISVGFIYPDGREYISLETASLSSWRMPLLMSVR